MEFAKSGTLAPMSDPWNLQESTAEQTACGSDDTYCATSMETRYIDRFRQEPCAIQTSAAVNTRTSNYNLWLPEYKKQPAQNDAFLLSDTSSRFGPTKVLQESFLQGRGQVTGSKECFASGLKYLPSDVFPDNQPAKTCSSKMNLFPQPTVLRKSCGSLQEVDMLDRLRPLPGIAQDMFLGPTINKGQVPTILNKSDAFANKNSNVQRAYGSRRDNDDRYGGETRTLSTKTYPTYAEIRKQQHDAMEE